MAMVLLRYELRVPADATDDRGERYRTCLEQCAWGDKLGLDSVVLSEHHGAPDGYMPAPLIMAAAIAGGTKKIAINISALLLPLHDPVRLAEQLAVLDLASGGRVSFVAGLGYRYEEFEMAGVDRSRRAPILEEYVEVMRKAWTGEPFEWQGRTIQVTPRPLTKPHPLMMIGGSTEKAARRAARLGLGFSSAYGDPALGDIYNEECAKVGFAGGFAFLPNGPGFVHVTEDPEKAWAQIGPHALYDGLTYQSWQTPGQRSAVDVKADDLEGVKASGVYRVVTPDECVALANELGSVLLHPLMGGMPIQLGWESLELFESKVLPRIR